MRILISARTLALFLKAMLMLGLSYSAFAQHCAVLDPELRGYFAGQCQGGLADGYGEARGVASYQGTFRAGRKHGSGVKIWPWGDRYQGEFINDAKEGLGHFSRSSTEHGMGDEYIGHFVSDRRQGFGEYRWSTGERVIGQWESDLPASVVDSQLYERLIADARAEKEAEIAMGRAGVRVCRLVKFGISEQEWIKGRVIDFRRPAISIEIDTPSRFPRILNEVQLNKGAIIWDHVRSWRPCV